MENQKDTREGTKDNAHGHERLDAKKQSKNDGVAFIVRKAEKLTSALYLVSDHMSDKEPIKWKAREIAVDLLSDVTLLASLESSEKITILRNTGNKIEKVIAFIDVARTSHLLSDMNASVLLREYVALKDNVEAEWNRVYEGNKTVTLSDAFFDVPTPTPPALLPKKEIPEAHPVIFSEPQRRAIEEARSAPRQLPVEVKPEFSKPLIGESESTRGKGELARALEVAGIRGSIPGALQEAPREQKIPIPPAITQNIKPHFVRMPTDDRRLPVVTGAPIAPHTPQSVATTPRETQRPTVEVVRDTTFGRARSEGDRDDRRKIILALIRQKPSLTVKDIAKSISGVSEKTIQRELLSMVAERILIKRGERRWSTYSLPID